jgi:hypothetical protein
MLVSNFLLLSTINFLLIIFLWINVFLIFIGDHSVEVKVDGIHVEGSPFLVKAYDASKVRVTDINTGFVGKPVNFNSENIFLFINIFI